VSVRLGASGVSRSFGAVRANDEVSLEIRRGTVHAVVGENGAGKTTLMRILYGLDRPDEGTVVIDGRPVSLRGPADGLAAGIGLVQQELALVPELTLLENLILGAEPTRGPVIDWRAARATARRLAGETGVDPPWDARAGDVSVSVRQQVEILRALLRGADVLIMDEPTAALAPAQAEDLLRLLRTLAENGRTVVFISHKVDEVLAVADTVTVLRGGRVVGTEPVAELDRARLVELIVGDAGAAETAAPSAVSKGDTVLSVADLATTDDRGGPRLRGVSFEVAAGEIVGVAGVAGNGQDELVECLVGLRRCTAGRIELAGLDLTRATVARRRATGLGYISADRATEGLSPQASLADNAIAGAHCGEPARRGWLSGARVRAIAHRVLDGYSVRYGRTTDPARTLSGGNQQRLVIGRELDREPLLLVAAAPTRGIDLHGMTFVHQRLREVRNRGGAVLLVSEQLDELITLADRVIVLHGGTISGELSAEDASRAAIGALMLGKKPA
jgi:ABC-type uncharacterized transport system ATPase subunit